METLAIVPARAGSESLPGKNISLFLGKPLIHWSIKSALEAESVSRVVVSTDSGEIAEVAKASGAEVPFLRPSELAKNNIVDYPVIRHCLDYLYEFEGYVPELIVQLRPTSPLRPASLIDKGVAKMTENQEAHSLRAVCPPANNPYKMWKIEDQYIVPLFDSDVGELYNQPRQQLPKTYWQIGVLDVFRRTTVYEMQSLTGKLVLPLFLDSKLAVDIDDRTSLERAEAICRSLGYGV